MSLGRIVLTTALATAVAAPMTRDHGGPTISDFDAREQVRIRAHFDSVLVELRARNVDQLPAKPRAERMRLIATLEAYRDRGLFPHNYDVPGLMPSFIDSRTGVRCAVGHLVESTGRGDIVERVARANNHVYVMELAGDTAFATWLDGNGLTLAEAARIQVPYMYEGPPPVTSRAGDFPVMLSAGSAIGLTALNLVANPSGRHQKLTIAGFGAGVVAFAVGRNFRTSGHASATLTQTSLVAGVASTAVSVFRAISQPSESDKANRVQVTPTVSRGQSAESRVGLNASFRF